MVVLDEGLVYVRSAGWIHALRQLPAPWGWGAALSVVPRPLRDACYTAFSRGRRRWFGTADTCPVPPPEIAPKFLDCAWTGGSANPATG